MVLQAGAKYIVVQGLPPVGCLPICISPCSLLFRDRFGCSIPINAAIGIHNRLLVNVIEKFRLQYPQSTIVYADYYKAFMEIFTNSAKYQFSEKTKVCCGAGGGNLNFDPNNVCGSNGASTCKNPNQYISWDGIHFTNAMNEKLSNLFFKGDFCQPSFASLVEKRKQAMAAKN